MSKITKYVECACSSDEHTLKYSLHLWDGEQPEVYTSVFLNNHESFWKRAWVAIKYVLGYKCKYGHWDCTILKPEQSPELRSLLKTYEQQHNEWVSNLKKK